jgi:hypothetical protein
MQIGYYNTPFPNPHFHVGHSNGWDAIKHFEHYRPGWRVANWAWTVAPALYFFAYRPWYANKRRQELAAEKVIATTTPQ